MAERELLSGNQAVSRAALAAGVALGTGYPGTPSTEILQEFARLGGRAEWAPNEKVALEVAIGVAFSRARALCTMKHVGVNVAADPLFTVAYTGVTGALVLVACDDPGLASSQNEQDSRRYAAAAGIPLIEPSDPQEAYDYFLNAITLSETWKTAVMFRMTTRVCHSQGVVSTARTIAPPPAPAFERDPAARVMVPGYARAAHKKLRRRLHDLQTWAESPACAPVREHEPADGRGGHELGVIANGISVAHAREADPSARVLAMGVGYPLPVERMRAFAHSVRRCVVVEEGDPVMAEVLLAAGIPVERPPERFRFGELDVTRVRRILARDDREEPAPPPGKPPQLCPGCPHRIAFEALKKLDCIVSGDIGCYTLGVMPPFQAMDACVCMGASIGVGLGMRHVLPEADARRVVSVIGDSTFVHSGLTGLAEMAYNPPATGHLVLLLDNGTTAMTGLQEHPGTGHNLMREETNRVDYEAVARAVGIADVEVMQVGTSSDEVAEAIRARLAAGKLSLLILRRPCVLAAKHLNARAKG